MERTFVMIKPDGIQKRLVGEVIKRIEDKKLRIARIKTLSLTKKQIAILYKDSFKKFPQVKKAIIEYMTSGPAIAFTAEGENAIEKARSIRGLSDPSKSPVGTIRRDFAGNQKMMELTGKGKATKNIMHASGSKEEAEFEINLFLMDKNEN